MATTRLSNRIFLAGCVLVASAGCLGGDDPQSTRNRVFITSTSYSSDLGGLTGGDARCNSLASAAKLGASFTAWLSDALIDARERIVGDGSWYLVDRSTLVFTSTPGITLGPVARIGMNESGMMVADTAAVWTGTRNDGTKSNNCNNWAAGGTQGLIGRASTIGWTASGLTSCANVARLYCFER